MTYQLTGARYVVRDGIEAEDGGPCEQWWVYRQYLHAVSEYEPEFPCLDYDWRDDDNFEAKCYASESDALTAATLHNKALAAVARALGEVAP